MIKPIKQERVIMSLLVMFAVGTVIEGVLDLIFTSNLVEIHTSYVNTSVSVGRLIFPDVYLFAFAMSVLLLGGVYYLLYRTRFGRSVRATMQDQMAARLIGINVNRVAAVTFGIGVAVTAVGGMMFGATSGGFNPNSGYDLISRLLAIIILGGLGSIGGALAAAMFMTTAEALVDIWSPDWAVVVFYVALVLVLAIRPAGLFGRAPARAQ